MKSIVATIVIIVVQLTLIACSTLPERKDMTLPEVSRKVAELQLSIEKGYEDQLDVLASQDFNKALVSSSLARELLNAHADVEEVNEEVVEAFEYLSRAEQTSHVVRHKAFIALEARKAALLAGVRTSEQKKINLEQIDLRLKAELRKVKAQELEKMALFQRDYLQLAGSKSL